MIWNLITSSAYRVILDLLEKGWTVSLTYSSNTGYIVHAVKGVKHWDFNTVEVENNIITIGKIADYKLTYDKNL